LLFRSLFRGEGKGGVGKTHIEACPSGPWGEKRGGSRRNIVPFWRGGLRDQIE